jgi:hypothetical protein
MAGPRWARGCLKKKETTMLRKLEVLILITICFIAAIVAMGACSVTSRPQTELISQNTSGPPSTPTAESISQHTGVPSATPVVEPTATPTPRFGPIAFGTTVRGHQVSGAGYAFPQGTIEIYAAFSYENMGDGTPYRLTWFLDDTPWLDSSLTWDAARYGSEGAAYVDKISEYDSDGLPVGNYRLELFIGERQAQLATFMILEATPTPIPRTAIPRPDLKAVGRDAMLSLVQVVVPFDDDWVIGGSGSIVDGEQGLILTNWHVITDESTGELLNDGQAAILIMTSHDEPPVFAYWAQVLPKYSDSELDLALLRITHLAEDESPVQKPLALPAIPLGKSEKVQLGDHVLQLGFPDYAGHQPSWTEGIVAAQTEDWILSDAQASHGHSGGMMLNTRGELVGVLTAVEETSVGGGFTAARPIDVAWPLIRKAIAAGEVP